MGALAECTPALVAAISQTDDTFPWLYLAVGTVDTSLAPPPSAVGLGRPISNPYFIPLLGPFAICALVFVERSFLLSRVYHESPRLSV